MAQHTCLVKHGHLVEKSKNQLGFQLMENKNYKLLPLIHEETGGCTSNTSDTYTDIFDSICGYLLAINGIIIAG